MRIETEVGHVVWHDLLTNDVTRAKRFYAERLGWEYQIEHASNFVWNPGEADYPLIMSEGEAHGGFVGLGQHRGNYALFKCADGTNAIGMMQRSLGAADLAAWVSYLATDNVKSTVIKAKNLGAIAYIEATDMPNVGQFVVLADPTGAVFGLLAPHES